MKELSKVQYFKLEMNGLRCSKIFREIRDARIIRNLKEMERN